MRPLYFDIHSHLNFKDYDADREQIISEMKEKAIWTTTIGTDLKSSQEAVELAEKHEHIFASIGLHPADNSTEIFNETAFADLVKNKKVVAIGECGLDYFVAEKHGGSAITEEEKKRQKHEFEKQIDFAVKYNKPLMIHCRSSKDTNDAHEDTFEILKAKQQQHGKKVRGNFHFFTSGKEIAEKCFELGFTVSFTGPITFVGALEDVVSSVPLEHMMAETDAPFAAPSPNRGKRNSPVYVQDVVAKIAKIKKLDLETVRAQLVENSLRFFGL